MCYIADIYYSRCKHWAPHPQVVHACSAATPIPVTAAPPKVKDDSSNTMTFLHDSDDDESLPYGQTSFSSSSSSSLSLSLSSSVSSTSSSAATRVSSRPRQKTPAVVLMSSMLHPPMPCSSATSLGMETNSTLRCYKCVVRDEYRARVLISSPSTFSPSTVTTNPTTPSTATVKWTLQSSRPVRTHQPKPAEIMEKQKWLNLEMLKIRVYHEQKEEEDNQWGQWGQD